MIARESALVLKYNISSLLSDSDRTVSSTGDWERTLPGHLYPYHLHDNLSVKFVFDDNDDGEEVRMACFVFGACLLIL